MDKQGYIVDLDGTMYKGMTAIPEAVQWANEMRRRGSKIMFATNNSAYPVQHVKERLERMGIAVAVEEILTSSQVTASYMKKQNICGPVMVIGEEGLREALAQAGCWEGENPLAVVQGIDRSFTYRTLAAALTAIQSGARYILTNADVRLPTSSGFAPGAGAISAAIRAASGVEPVVIGKPSRYMIDEAMSRMGLSPDQVAVVGDNLNTDIRAGINAGVETVLVLTGVSTEEEALQTESLQPTLIVRNLAEWV